jgi:hypothetical protein
MGRPLGVADHGRHLQTPCLVGWSPWTRSTRNADSTVGRAIHSQDGLEPTNSPGHESSHGHATITGHRGDVSGEVMADHQERLASCQASSDTLSGGIRASGGQCRGRTAGRRLG